MSQRDKQQTATQQTSVRKYLYLVTEHEEEDRVGGISVMDSQMSRPTKNNEAPIRIIDEEKEDFRIVGKKVGMGYHDFESEDAYDDNDRFVEVVEKKLGEIDEEWLDKADVPEEVRP